jgi:hypothetical protein
VSEAPEPRGGVAWAPWLALLAFAALAAIVLTSALDVEPWDDAFFFKRIGWNLLHHGTAAWNLADGPVYGNTSQGFQLLALLPLALVPGFYMTAIKVLSALGLVATFALCARAARRTAEPALATAVAFVGAGAPFARLLVGSGMETCASLAALALALVVVASGRTGPIVATTTLVYLMRPDAVLVPLVALTVESLVRTRRLPWRPLLGCAVALALVLGACQLYFGTPLPLPFYLKSSALTAYDAAFVQMNLGPKHKNLLGFALFAAPLVFVAAHGRGARIVSLLAAAAALVVYHDVFTLEIMGYYARFYVPALVPLTLAAVEAAPGLRLRARWPVTLAFVVVHLAVIVLVYRARLVVDAKEALHTRLRLELYLGYALAAALLLLGAPAVRAGRLRAAAVAIAVPLVLGFAAWRGLPHPSPLVYSDAALVEKAIDRFTTARGIRAVRACLREPLTVYHSEIGIPGLYFPDSRIVDLAGLMDRELARGHVDLDARCAKDRPEVFFLPHRNYKRQREAIARSTCLRDYRQVVSNSSSPLYVRNDLADEFVACAARMKDPWVSYGLARTQPPK